MNCFETHFSRIFKEKLGKSIIEWSRIETGKHNTSFFITTESGEYVIRIAPPDDTTLLFYEHNMMAQEPGIHRTLRERTDVPVAEVLLLDQSRELIDRDYMIMGRLEGNPLSQVSVTREGYEGVMRQIGEYLSQVHAIETGRYGYIGAHAPMEPQHSWWEAFRIMWAKLIDDTVGVGMYSEREKEMLTGTLEKHRACFDRPVQSSLLHMDVWAQNILVDADLKVTGLIDWDWAMWGDPEIEYAVLDYCGISTPAFWEGYGRAPEDSPEAGIRRTFYFLYEHQKYILIRLGRRHDLEAARRYKAESLHVLRTNLKS